MGKLFSLRILLQQACQGRRKLRLTPFRRACHTWFTTWTTLRPRSRGVSGLNIKSLGNTPSRQAGSSIGRRRLAEGDVKTAHRAVSIRPALFIAWPLGVRIRRNTLIANAQARPDEVHSDGQEYGSPSLQTFSSCKHMLFAFPRH
jgi:hypothetical protein